MEQLLIVQGGMGVADDAGNGLLMHPPLGSKIHHMPRSARTGSDIANYGKLVLDRIKRVELVGERLNHGGVCVRKLVAPLQRVEGEERKELSIAQQLPDGTAL
jgi:hypothetical protein